MIIIVYQGFSESLLQFSDARNYAAKKPYRILILLQRALNNQVLFIFCSALLQFFVKQALCCFGIFPIQYSARHCLKWR